MLCLRHTTTNKLFSSRELICLFSESSIEHTLPPPDTSFPAAYFTVRWVQSPARDHSVGVWGPLAELTDVRLCFCSAGQWQIAEEHLGHRGGDGRGRAVWLLGRFHRRAHQSVPVWRLLTSGQGEGSALPRPPHRCETHSCTNWMLLFAFFQLPSIFLKRFCQLETCIFHVGNVLIQVMLLKVSPHVLTDENKLSQD